MNENYHIDKEKVIERLEDIEKAVLELKKFQNMSASEFDDSNENYPIASYYLRIALEAVLVTGTHILAHLPTNGKKKDYTQVILSLGDYKVIPQEFAEKIKGMASMRNRLVHLYWKINSEELLKIINEDLGDFEEFSDYIREFIA